MASLRRACTSRDQVADARCLFVLLRTDGGVLVGLEFGQACLESRHVDLQAEPQPQPGSGLVDEVDRLVRQHSLRQVAVAELDGGAQGVVGEAHAVVLLVRGPQTAQDQHGILQGRLADAHRLEPALERGVLLDHAVLLQRGRADQVQVAAGESRLQDVPGIHRAVAAAAGADDRVHLVDEQDQLTGQARHLVHRRGQALLEVAAVTRAGEHRRKVESDHALVAQLLGHGAGDDRPGEPLDDRGLAHTGLADEHGVVLRPAAQDLDGLLDLILTPDDRVERTLARERGQVGAEAVQHRGRGCRCGLLLLLGRGRAARRHGLAGPLQQGIGGDARLGEDLARGGVLTQHEREEQVLGVDVGRAGGPCHLERVEERALHRRGDHRAVDVGGVGCRGQALLDGAGDRARVGTHPLDGVLGRGFAHQDAQNVERVEFALAAFERVRAGLLQELLRAQAQEAREVDRPRRASALAVEVAREELVERARAALAVLGCEVFGHFSPGQT